MKTKKQRLFLVFIGVAMISAIGLGVFFSQPSSKPTIVETTATPNKASNNKGIHEIDVTKIPSGTYHGKYELDDISVKVSVDIKDGNMENIQILSHQEDMNDSANEMISNMIKQQKIDVDVVSSATTSNTLIKEALVNALSK